MMFHVVVKSNNRLRFCVFFMQTKWFCCSGNNSFCSSLFWDFAQDEFYSSSYCFCWLRNWNNAEAYQTGNKVVTLHNFEINFSLRWPFLLTGSSSSRYYYELMLQVCHLSHSIPYMNFADLLGKFCVFCKVGVSTSTNIWSYNYLEWETTEKKFTFMKIQTWNC